MSLKDTMRAAKQGLSISMKHEKWLTDNPNPTYSEKALEFAHEQLLGVKGSQRLRKKMFRASAAQHCHRQQVFNILGAPKKEEIESKLSNIFATGNFLHLKWQMQGLTAGWLLDAEVPVDRPELNAGGTMDGVTWDAGGFEFKSINSRGYAGVQIYGPKEIHLRQVDNYMFLGGLDHFSIVYENKDTGDWREFRVDRDDKRMEEAEKGFHELNGYLERKEMPRMLMDCEDGIGTQFRNCPYRDICPRTKGFPEGKPL